MTAQQRLDGLYGREPLSERAVLESMKDLERSLSEELGAAHTRAAQAAALRHRALAPLADLVKNDADAAKAAGELLSMGKRREKRVVPPHIATAGNLQVWPGGWGATVPRPFQYAWNWDATNGDGRAGASPDRSSGDISAWAEAGDDSGGNGNARGALGIYFYPPTSGAWLQVWAAPAYSWFWTDSAVLDSSHTDGFVGIFAGSYDLSGAYTGAVADHRVQLWSDDAHFTSATASGDNSAFPLSAAFAVDREHQYILWVWCGAYATGDGSHLFYGSDAYGEMMIAVPSISWFLS
jgi:hypothetical protein